jgi:predicted nicotinamide N-methyase
VLIRLPPGFDPAAFLAANARPIAPPTVPELVVYTAVELTPLWEATEASLGKAGLEPPFWAFAWPGSVALARWILDHPAELAGKTVVDVGTGNGLAAIAAARVGASVYANDVDEMALAATRINAALNGVAVDTVHADLTTGARVDAEIVLVGDLFYERAVSERLFAWLRGLARDRRVIVAEPGRAFAPRDGVHPIARYTVPTTRELESGTERDVVILEVG